MFLNAVVEDRQPTPGVGHLKGAAMGIFRVSGSMIGGRSAYPQPPTKVAMNADVVAMAHQYSQYREGKHTLAGMAYFCLTVLEQAAGNRSAIRDKFGIASTVIAALGRLTSERGGAEARKGKGRPHPFTADERNWIEQTTKRLIRRVAEIAHDPDAIAPLITLGHLPKLTMGVE